MRERLFNRALNLGRFLATPLQTAFHNLLFPRALGDFFRIGLGPPGQIFQRSQNALKLTVKLFVFVFGEIFQRHLENKTIGAGRDRKFLILIRQIERAFFETHLQFAALEDASVLIGQDWKQNFVAQIGFERAPIDVEIGRIHRARTVLEHVHPPFVAGLGDPHVIGHEVEHLTYSVSVQFRNPRVVLLLRTDCLVEFVVIGNVVAVQTVRAGLKIGRRINVAHAERAQIRNDLARLREGEPAVELQPVGAGRNSWMLRFHHKRKPRQNLQNKQDECRSSADRFEIQILFILSKIFRITSSPAL